MRVRSLHILILTLLPLWQATADDAPGRVVMISVDGMMPAYYLQADALGLRIPNLRRLMREGAYGRVNGVLPTVTYPSHTTLITGVMPRRHGIGNNRFFDPQGLSNGAWRWYTREIQVPTLVSAARARGLKTGSSSWPVSVGDFTDYNLPEFERPHSTHASDLMLLESMTTPGLLKDIERSSGRPFAYPLTDVERTAAAVHILKSYRPELLLLHIFDLDDAEHDYGPMTREALQAVEASDAHIGEVLAALEALSLRAATLVAVVSDHGFLSIQDTLRPNTLLREAGLLETGPDGQVTKWQAIFHAAGGTSFLHLQDGAPADTVARVRAVLAPRIADVEGGIRNVLEPAEIEAFGGIDVPLVLNALEGFAFADDAVGAFKVASKSKGTHGYVPDRAEMQASLILAGPGVMSRGDLGSVPMTSIAPTLARVLGVALDPHAGPPLP